MRQLKYLVSQSSFTSRYFTRVNPFRLDHILFEITSCLSLFAYAFALMHETACAILRFFLTDIVFIAILILNGFRAPVYSRQTCLHMNELGNTLKTCFYRNAQTSASAQV